MTHAKEVRLLEHFWDTLHNQVEVMDLSILATPLPLVMILSLWSIAQIFSMGRQWLDNWYVRMHMGDMTAFQIIRLYRLYET